MSKNTNGASLKRLKDVLLAYGGDPVRWPDDERDELLALLRGNAEAGLMRSEQSALDKVLDSPAAPSPSSALRSRILQVAMPQDEAGTVPIVSGPVVINLQQRSQERAQTRTQTQSASARRAGRPPVNWQTAALLAASLLIGVWIGAGGTGSSLVSETLDLASLQSGGDSYNYDIGLSDAEELL